VFCKNNGIDIETAEFTPEEFIELTKREYGGEYIRELEGLRNG